MKAIIEISKNINDYKYFKGILEDDRISKNISEIVVSDSNHNTVQFFANAIKLPLKKFATEWDRYGRSAYMIRCKHMADYADILIAIWDNQSAEVKFSIDYMHILKKPVYVFTPKIHARRHNIYKSGIDYTVI